MSVRAYVGLSVRKYSHAYVRPSVHNKFVQFQRYLACRQRLTSDTRRYAVWPDPRSGSRAFQSWKSVRFQKLSPPPLTRVGPVYRLCSSLVHSLPYLLLFITFSLFSHSLYLFSSIVHLILSTRIVSLRFQAWGRRRGPHLGLVCLIYDCVICIA